MKHLLLRGFQGAMLFLFWLFVLPLIQALLSDTLRQTISDILGDGFWISIIVAAIGAFGVGVASARVQAPLWLLALGAMLVPVAMFALFVARYLGVFIRSAVYADLVFVPIVIGVMSLPTALWYLILARRKD